MCGIAGLINFNADKKFDFNKHILATEVFKALEIRGKHASGYSYLNKGEIVLKKAPLRSTDYVNTDDWSSLEDKEIEAMLIHTRFLTKGSAEKNDNNHPFISKDGRFTVVHNGVIDDITIRENNNLKEDKDIETDSYVVIQLIEKFVSENPDKSMLDIMTEVASKLDGNYAIMVIDKKESKFYTFRNSSRPLFSFISKEFDLMYFCSTKEIFSKGFTNAFCKNENIEIAGISSDTFNVYQYDIKEYGNIESKKYTQVVYKKKTYVTSYPYYGSSNTKPYNTGHSYSSDTKKYYDDYDDFYTKKYKTPTKTEEKKDCIHCDGSGIITDERSNVNVCDKCNGEGSINKVVNNKLNCCICGGTGYQKKNAAGYVIKSKCSECDGKGYIKEVEYTIEVDQYK